MATAVGGRLDLAVGTVYAFTANPRPDNPLPFTLDEHTARPIVIAGLRSMLEPAKLSNLGSHYLADMAGAGSYQKFPPSEMRELARAIAKD